MATGTGRTRCITYDKEKSAVRCEGCLQIFCFNHLLTHRQELSKQLDEIEVNRALCRQTLTEQTTDRQKHSVIKQIDKWEEDTIKKIQQTAQECRQLVFQHTNGHINQIEVNLATLTDQLRQTRQENDFDELDLSKFKEKLTKLAEELDKPPNVIIQYDSTSFINKISLVVSPRQLLSFTHIDGNTKWIQKGITVAGENGKGNELNQLSSPCSVYVGDDQSIYITDFESDHILEWKYNAKNGQVVAGGNGYGNQMNQLNMPSDMIIDKNNDSLIICDYKNNRVMRCVNSIYPQIYIFYWKNPGYLYNKMGEPGESDIIE